MGPAPRRRIGGGSTTVSHSEKLSDFSCHPREAMPLSGVDLRRKSHGTRWPAAQLPAVVGDRGWSGRRELAVDVPVLHPLPARGRPAVLVLQLDAFPGADAGVR